jgi:TPR repeat protein
MISSAICPANPAPVRVMRWQHRRRHLYPAPGNRHAGGRNQAKLMKAILRSGFLALAAMASTVPASAGPYDDGVAAYQRGDFAAALKFWRPLAEQGIPQAQNVLGTMYNNGQGVPQDHAEAGNLWRLAAAQGLAAAQFNLGTLFANGRGVPQNDAEAVNWYRKSAEQGYTLAQYNIGLMYYSGRSVSQDKVQAYMWLTLAAKRGAKFAERVRDISASQMTPDQIAEAQRLAREWTEEHRQ